MLIDKYKAVVVLHSADHCAADNGTACVVCAEHVVVLAVAKERIAAHFSVGTILRRTEKTPVIRKWFCTHGVTIADSGAEFTKKIKKVEKIKTIQ